MSLLPRVTAFPILPEGHMLYKMSGALSMPSKEKHGGPLIGKPAPEIILKDQLGRDCSLHATIALGRPIVLFFFPLAGSPHCTLESCYFRDALAESAVFADLDAIIIGVSQDSPQTLSRFAAKHDLGYIILSDHEREAMQTFGVTRTWMGLINGRSTFVIDPDGIVRAQCEGVLAAAGHRQFAEKWLIRIEHELVGRDRNVEELRLPSSGDDTVADQDDEEEDLSSGSAHENKMATGGSSTYRVVRGKENSAPSAGIDKAPRYGAAPLPPMPHIKSPSSGKFRGLISKHKGGSADHIASSFPTQSTHFAAQSNDDLQLRSSGRQVQSPSSRARAASLKSSKKGLRNFFQRQEAMPPTPILDPKSHEDLVHVYGEVAGVSPPTTDSGIATLSDGRSGASSGSQPHSRANSAQDHPPSSFSHGSDGLGHGSIRGVTSSSSFDAVLYPQSRPSKMGRRIPVPTVSGTVQDQQHQRAASDTVNGNTSPKQNTDAEQDTDGTLPLDEAGHLATPTVGREPNVARLLSTSSSSGRRPSTAPTEPSVLSPRELRGSTSNSFMRRTEGILSPSSLSSSRTPKARNSPLHKQSSPLLSSRSTVRPQEATTSSSIILPPGSRPSTAGEGHGSFESVRQPMRTASGGTNKGYSSVDSRLDQFDRRVTSLSPAPPGLRQNRGDSARNAKTDSSSIRGSTPELRSSSSTARDTPTPPPRGSIESLSGAQVQAAKRMVIHRKPVSPQRVASIRTTNRTASEGIVSRISPVIAQHAQFADANDSTIVNDTKDLSLTSKDGHGSEDIVVSETSPKPETSQQTTPEYPIPPYAPPPPPSVKHTNNLSPTQSPTSPGSNKASDVHQEWNISSKDNWRYSAQSAFSHHDYGYHDNDGASVMTTSTTQRRPSAASVASHDSHSTTGTFGL
ncbi:unnamed protein product [Sympodiomycopsis kandeliae]